MRLRHWQEECSSKAFKAFKTGKKNFMALATPASGKTVMAATVAKYLLKENLIDFVVCFAPSVAVQKSMELTFAKILGRPMHGKLGAAGGVFTYQFLTSSKSADWSFLKRNRVFAVFDEIHHCGGQDIELANSWGREILSTISINVSYILAMTGTPWRTDQAPISLARYIEPDFIIKLDYEYGLARAINDNVCRLPEIILIDNDNLAVNQKNYSSLSIAMAEADLQYSRILNDFEALSYTLSIAVKKLAEVRLGQPDAGGLVVASSVDAAIRIQALLVSEFGQSSVLVSYKENNSQEIIDNFRTSSTQWIVSVSMVSEGTDIPRLRVCAHLSTVRTELFYRQVLGRVLRLMANVENQRAFLITFAEPSLTEFTIRLKEDVPQMIVNFEKFEGKPTINPKTLLGAQSNTKDNANAENSLAETNWHFKNEQQNEKKTLAPCVPFQLKGQYRQQVFSIF